LERFAGIVDLRRSRALFKNACMAKTRAAVIYVHLTYTAAMSVKYTFALIAMVEVYAVTPRSRQIARNVRIQHVPRNESIQIVYTTNQGTTAKYVDGRIYAITIDVNPLVSFAWAVAYANIAK